MKVYFYPTGLPSAYDEYDVPIKVITDSFLDEMLDTSAIELRDTETREPYAPFTIVQMGTIPPTYWMVGSDIVQEIKATGLYNHTVQLIEPTKWLERWMVGSKSVTQPIYSERDSIIASPIDGSGATGHYYYEKDDEPGTTYDYDYFKPFLKSYNYYYKTGLKENKEYLHVYSKDCFESEDHSTYFKSASMHYRVYKNSVLLKEGDSSTEDGEEILDSISAAFGNYIVAYDFIYTITGNNSTYKKTAHLEFHIAVISEKSGKKNTLCDAAESFIYASQNLLEGEESLFSIDIYNKLLDLTAEAPELTVTNATLREALDEIGKCIGAITVLNICPDKKNDKFKYEIFFEKFCKNEQANLEVLGEGTDVIIQRSCEDYCTVLDATVDNLVQYAPGGSVSMPTAEPKYGTTPCVWKTLRTEDASYRVTEDTAEIMTDFPIERLDKVLVFKPGEGGFGTIDITPFCYESAEYATLSSYSPAYPLSKAYALEYSIGKKGIRGLGFTVPNPIHAILEKPAIVNIINTVGKKTFQEMEWVDYSGWKTLDFTTLQFRVTYVPTGAARIRMRKPNSLGKPESVLAFNQSAAKLDARAFGRNMFGAVLRMGNTETQTTYVVPIDTTIPEKGQRVGADGYIAEVKTEYASDTKKVTLTVVEGFNRLSAFVGVNQSLRMYEISERMSLDRHLIYEDFCCISTTGTSKLNTSPLCKETMWMHLKKLLLNEEKEKLELTAIAQGYDKDENLLQKCLLPCITYGIGNAIVSTFSYIDNYSAGKKLDSVDKRLIDDKSGYYRTQSDVPYGDFFGEMKTMSLELVSFACTTPSGDWNAEHFKSIADELPAFNVKEIKGISQPTVIVSTEKSRRLVVKKDSRECLKSITYQLNFLQKDGVVITSALAEKMQHSNTNCDAVLVLLEQQINETTERITFAKENSIDASITFTDSFPNVVAEVNTSELPEIKNAVAWAYVLAYEYDQTNGKYTGTVLFGENFDQKDRPTRDKNIRLFFDFFHK